MTYEDAVGRYGEIVNGIWQQEHKWCEIFRVPDEISKTWINSATGRPTIHIYCNKDLTGQLAKALQNVISRHLVNQLRTFDGCLCQRNVRGDPTRVSSHSYGIAIDINASTNPLGEEGDISDELLACFIDCGIISGKTFKRIDPMHLTIGW